MDLTVRDDIRRLINAGGEGHYASIYMPTHRGVTYNHEDPIKFKNLLRKAEELLVEGGIRRPDAEKFMKPARGFLLDNMFWQYLSDGLAVFVGEKTINYYRLPLSFEELVSVGDKFLVKPLIPFLKTEGRFYVLAVSHKSVRVFWGTHHDISEIDVKNVPGSISEALKYDVYEDYIQQHATTQGKMHGGEAVFHGHGIGIDDLKDELFRYFRKVDRGLREFLRNEKAPLVLAGVDYLTPIYRDANTYPHLAGEAIKGNTERMPSKELHQRAWEIAAPYYKRAREEAFAFYLQLGYSNPKLTSRDIREIIAAAYAGRVSALFIAGNVQIWGHFNNCTNEISFHEKEGPGAEELLDLAATHTLFHGGEVYTMEQDKMPDKASAAAIFRY